MQGLKFTISDDRNGEPIDELNKLFAENWFSKFKTHTLGARIYGNSLLEMSFNNKNKLVCTLIPRANVVPEFQMIRENSYSQPSIDYSVPFYSNTLIDINNEDNPRNLGELLSATKMVLMKQEALENWSEAVEKYAQPILEFITDEEDEAKLALLDKFGSEVGRNKYFRHDSTSEVKFTVPSNTGAASTMYKDHETFCNEEVSKIIIGSTMINDSGSSRSQSDTHEKTSYLYTKDDITFLKDYVDNELMPVLAFLGYNTEHAVITIDEPEIMTTDEKIKVDEFILKNFDVKDDEYYNKRYGRTGLVLKKPEKPKDIEQIEKVEEVEIEKIEDIKKETDE